MTRYVRQFALLSVAIALSAPAFGAEPMVKTMSGKVSEYCAAEGLSSGACEASEYFELRASCDAGATAVAVSCGLQGLDGTPQLVENAIGPDKYARCVWHYPSAPPLYDLPSGTMTVLCRGN